MSNLHLPHLHTNPLHSPTDAYALAKAGLAPLETVVEILRALQGEETSIVWGAIAGVLGGLHLLMEQLGKHCCAFCCVVFMVVALFKNPWRAVPLTLTSTQHRHGERQGRGGFQGVRGLR